MAGDGATAGCAFPDRRVYRRVYRRVLRAGFVPGYVARAVSRLAAIVLVLTLATAHRAAAAVPSCKRSCRNLQANCLDFARQTLATAKAACSGSGGTLRACRRAAVGSFRHDRKDCRTLARTTCTPCCKLGAPTECAHQKGVPLPAEPQSGGDPVVGRQILLNGDYMTCGVPYRLWTPLHDLIATGFGGKADAPRIADREGKNAELPYFLNVFTTAAGAEVINGNCLMCHGGVFDGQLVVGLGNPVTDFTRGAGGVANGVPLTDAVLNALGLTEAEKAELLKIADRANIVAPATLMRAIGMNPAEILAVVLMVHHDQTTLAWSDTPLTTVPFLDDVEHVLTSDPPPWWRAHKKNALFYNGMARGDHRGTMALATSVCVDDVPRAQYVDGLFRDIEAFVDSIRAPAYTRSIDAALAAKGHDLFNRDCSGCHGTYAARDEDETYPSLLIPLDVVGTDPVVAELGVVHAPQLVAWYNASFYGQITRMEPNDPFPGYMPPPLDGIWATAPYLHNGSVPTVDLLLNSRARPRYWRRMDLDSTHFDEEALGWPYVAFDAPPTGLPDAEQKLVYDTTLWSQSNAGHTFGDHLTAEERRAVIEYLKTL
jgi:mono/diheme cytochrome c family protein